MCTMLYTFAISSNYRLMFWLITTLTKKKKKDKNEIMQLEHIKFELENWKFLIHIVLAI